MAFVSGVRVDSLLAASLVVLSPSLQALSLHDWPGMAGGTLPSALASLTRLIDLCAFRSVPQLPCVSNSGRSGGSPRWIS